MKTHYLKINPERFDPEQLRPAADILAGGGLVAFPTETVYGLGAVINHEAALHDIFQVKGRPDDNPLILHIWHHRQLSEITETVDPRYQRLIDAFWPGPLTLIFPKKAEISSTVTAGLPTVAVRMPSHPVARELLRLVNRPVAAPSANLSGRPSPTRGEHVREDLDGKIPMIIDAGPCPAGIESTVLLLAEKPYILRPGSVTREMVEEILAEPVEVVTGGETVDRPQAPGMKYRHYAPEAPVTLVEGEEQAVVAAINRMIGETGDENIIVLAFSEHLNCYQDVTVLDLGPRESPWIAAARLYDLLRSCDQMKATRIYVEGLEKTGVGTAVENRLFKAAGGNVIHVS